MTDDARKESFDWTEKYRPKSLNEVVGNHEAISQLSEWAEEWEKGPKKRCAILMGPPGCGKTSAAIALANEKKWTLIELNASDIRSGENIRRIAMTGAVNETFTPDGRFVSTLTGRHKLIVMDEADNLYERGGGAEAGALDKGGKRAIVQMIKETRQPVILIVNDYYALTSGIGKELYRDSITIKFRQIDRRTIKSHLHKICLNEKITMEPEVLDAIADISGGDLRSAIHDLQTVSLGKNRVSVEDLKSLGYRDRESSIWDAMRRIFKGSDFAEACEATKNLDESPEDISMWVDENIPLEYRECDDMERAYECLSRADIFLGRVFRRQHYALWGYASALMTGGVALAKSREYHGFVKYQSPNQAEGWIGKMSKTKGTRQIRDEICERLGNLTHTSTKDARKEIFPAVKFIFAQDWEFSIYLTKKLELEEEHVAFLLDEDIDSARVKKIMNAVKRSEGEVKNIKEYEEEAEERKRLQKGLGEF